MMDAIMETAATPPDMYEISAMGVFSSSFSLVLRVIYRTVLAMATPTNNPMKTDSTIVVNLAILIFLSFLSKIKKTNSMITVSDILSRPVNIILAAVIVELVALILARNGVVGNVINDWYDKFGVGAYICDVGSMCFGVLLALVLFKYMLPASMFTPVNFLVSVVLIQMTHDLLFGAITRAYEKGKHRMMDMFKRYMNENGWKILMVDAVMMISTVLLVYAFLSVDDAIIYLLLAFLLYITQFFIFK
jgi:hypothetical protein